MLAARSAAIGRGGGTPDLGGRNCLNVARSKRLALRLSFLRIASNLLYGFPVQGCTQPGSTPQIRAGEMALADHNQSAHKRQPDQA